MADKQKLHKHVRKKDQNLRKKVEGMDEDWVRSGRGVCSVPASRYNTQMQCCPASKGSPKHLFF